MTCQGTGLEPNLAGDVCVICSPTYCATCEAAAPNKCSSYRNCTNPMEKPNLAGDMCFNCAVNNANCAHCESAFSCEQCKPGFVRVDANNDGVFEGCVAGCAPGMKESPFLKKCLPCTVPNCESCFPGNQCGICAAGMSPTPDRKACQVCTVANCLKCEAGKSRSCNFCQFGYRRTYNGGCIRR